MFHLSHKTTYVSLLILASLVLAACGAASAQTSTSSSTTELPPAPATSGETAAPTNSAYQSPQMATVLTGDTSLGQVLTNSDGMTLYLFENDSVNQSTCSGTCAKNWPPVMVAQGTTPSAGAGVNATLGVIQRADGSSQLTINGMPVYLYAGDSTPGDTNGQGLLGKWFVLDPSGNSIHETMPASPGG